jgi:hypothetical protein
MRRAYWPGTNVKISSNNAFNWRETAELVLMELVANKPKASTPTGAAKTSMQAQMGQHNRLLLDVAGRPMVGLERRDMKTYSRAGGA